MTVPSEITQEKVLTQEKQEVPTQAPPPQENEHKEGQAQEDPNWKAFREARKQDRLQKEQAERKAAEKEAEVQALKAAMEAAFARESRAPKQQQQSYNDYEEQEESEDERIEKKVAAAMAAREAAADRARAEREQQEYPQRLAQMYPDFNQVISSENLDYLEYHYPEVASPLKRLPDGQDKWADIYRACKKFIPNSTGAKKDSAKADVNFNKPRSMSSGFTQVGDGIAQTRLTDDRKASNWERMQKTLKGLS